MATTLTTTTATMSAEVRTAYDLRLLQAARPKLIFAQFGSKRPIPKGQGKFIQLRRVELIPAATVPLSEGVTPAGNTLVISQVNLGIQQYGDYIQVSDVLTWVDIDPILTEGADILGEQAGKTIDSIASGYMNIGSSVRYANGKVARNQITATDKINSLDVKKIVRDLEKASVGTIDGNFVGIVSPDTALDITALPEWLTTQQYNSATGARGLFNNEIGSLFNVRFVKAERAVVFAGQGAGGVDVHSTLIFGANAFVSTEIEGEALQMIAKPLGSAGAGDPLNQRATQGWKATFGGAVANDLFVVRYEAAVTGA